MMLDISVWGTYSIVPLSATWDLLFHFIWYHLVIRKKSIFCDLTACHALQHTDVTRTIRFLFYNSFSFLGVILFLLFWFISFCSCFPPLPPPLSSPYCSSLRHLLSFVPLFIASSTLSPASFLYSSLLSPPLLPLLIPPLSSSSDHLPQTKY